MEYTTIINNDLQRSSSPTLNDSLERPHQAVQENKPFKPVKPKTTTPLDKFERFSHSLRIIFEQNKTKLSNQEKVLDILYSQGATLSVEHKIPILENMFERKSDSQESGMFSFLKTLGSEATHYFNIEFWLTVYFWISVSRLSLHLAGHSDSKNYIALTKLSYIVLTFLIISVTLHEVMNYGTDNSFLNSISEVYNVLKDEWNEISNSNFDDVQMEALPMGFEESINFSTYGILALLAFFSSLKVKNEAATTVMNLLRFNATSTDNLASILRQASSKISSFFEYLKMDNLSQFFHVDIITDADTSKWLKEAKHFLSATSTGDVNNSAFYTEVYGDILTTGKKLLKSVEKNSYDSRVINEYMKKLNECDDRIQTLKKSLNGTRIEAVGVLIYGLPATFKTVLRDRLSYYVGAITIPEPWLEDFEKDPKEFEFALPKDRFFDKYNYKKWSVTIDDIFQARDTVGDPESEALKVISMINSSEYMLTMAKVEDKNGYYFRSPFVYATTNLSNFGNLSSVESPPAVKRRFNIQLDVTVSERYTNPDGTTDFSLMPTLECADLQESGVDERCSYVPDDFWNIKMTVRNGDNSEEFFNQSIDEVVEAIVRAHHSRIKNFYANRYVEKKLKTTKAANLRDKFNSKGFANLQFRTLEPVAIAQGGDDTDSVYHDIFPPLSHFLDRLDWNKRASYDNEFINQICSMRISLFSKVSINSYLEAFDTVSDHDKEILINFLNTDQLERFMKYMVCIMIEREDSDRHPITGVAIPSDATYSTVLQKIKEYGLKIVGILDKYKVVVLLVAFVTPSIIHWLFKATEEVSTTMISQSVDLSRDRARVGKPSKIKLGDKAATLTMRAQAPKIGTLVTTEAKIPPIDISILGQNTNQNDVLKRVIDKFFYIVYFVSYPNGEPVYSRFGHAWNIRGQVFSVPLHFLYKWHDLHMSNEYKGAHLAFTTTSRSCTYVCSVEDVLTSFKVSEDSASNDCCLFTIPSAHHNSTGLLKYLLKLEDYKVLQKSTAISTGMFGSFHEKDRYYSTCLRMDYMKSRPANHQVVIADWEKDKPLYELENVWRYDGSYANGSCGSLLYLTDVTQFNSRFLLGMHVAGGKGYGASSVILQEWVELLLDDAFPTSTLFQEEEIPPFLTETPAEAQGSMQPTYTVNPSHSVSSSSRSSIVKSKLFGKLPHPYRKVEFFPAKLHKFIDVNGQERNPGYIALQKYNKQPVYIDPIALKKAVASYEALIIRHMSFDEETRKIVPLDDALHAFLSINTVSSSTSPGFPMSLKDQENIKKLYYDACIAGDEVNKKIYLSRIAVAVESRLKKYAHGIRPAIFYKDCLKDETRKIEKVQTGSTRLFSACEFITLVMFRMYFGSFISSFFEANINIGSGIGINCYSLQWDDLARRLLMFSETKGEKCVGAGDYSAFDTSLHPIILYHILDMINRWYGEDNPDNDIRRKLWAEIVNSKHIWENEVYEWIMSQPSGNPITGPLNSMYNQISVRMCYSEEYPIETFNDNVYVVVYGDDIAFTASRYVRANFNEMSLQKLMPKFGLKYTSELKEDAVVPFRQLTDIEFLKRKFRFDPHENRWVAPLRLESIFATPNWTKRGLLGDQITVDILSSTLSELSLHGREIFNAFANKLIELKNAELGDYEPARPYSNNFDYVYGETLRLDFYYPL